MLNDQKAWKRDASFDRIEITAEMDEQRLRTGFDSQPFYTKLYNSRWPHIPAELALEMIVDVERSKMENLLSQPAPPPQCDSSPRRFSAVDTGSDEPEKPRRSLAIGTGSDKPGVVVVVDSHIQRIVLVTEETTVTQQVSHRSIKCQSRLWSQRGT